MNTAALEHNDETDPRALSAELVMGTQRLLVAHADIHTVAPIKDVRIESGCGHAIGSVRHGEHVWAVFSLDADLEFLATVPATRRSCVLLRLDDDAELGGVALLCDELRVLDNASLTMVPVPGCMSGEESPMEAFAIVNGEVICAVSAARLSAWLRRGVAGGAVDRQEAAGEE